MQIENYKELYQERAAIMEFDGGLTRQKAEEKALSEVADIFTKDQNLKFNEPKTHKILAEFKRDLKNA